MYRFGQVTNTAHACFPQTGKKKKKTRLKGPDLSKTMHSAQSLDWVYELRHSKQQVVACVRGRAGPKKADCHTKAFLATQVMRQQIGWARKFDLNLPCPAGPPHVRVRAGRVPSTGAQGGVASARCTQRHAVYACRNQITRVLWRNRNERHVHTRY